MVENLEDGIVSSVNQYEDVSVDWFVNLLTPWCRVLLEKLTRLQLVKKLPAFHGTRRFITALTSVRHLSLSWASPIQSIYPHTTSWRSILILSTHLRLGLPNGLLPSSFPTKILYTPSPHPYAPHVQPISFFSILSPTQYWVGNTKEKTLTNQNSIHEEIPSRLNSELLTNSLSFISVVFFTSICCGEVGHWNVNWTGHVHITWHWGVFVHPLLH